MLTAVWPQRLILLVHLGNAHVLIGGGAPPDLMIIDILRVPQQLRGLAALTLSGRRSSWLKRRR